MKAKLSDFRTRVRSTIKKALQESKLDKCERWVFWDYDGNLCYTAHPESVKECPCIATCFPDGSIEDRFVF